MRLNTLKPAKGAKKQHHRLGRGIGSGTGKTSGKGHKGQHARAGGYHKVGFEGGQMPMQRRIPKYGFNSMKALQAAQIRLHELEQLGAAIVDLKILREANLIANNIKTVKIIASGNLTKSITLKGLRATKGAKAAIEAAGGKIEA